MTFFDAKIGLLFAIFFRSHAPCTKKIVVITEKIVSASFYKGWIIFTYQASQQTLMSQQKNVTAMRCVTFIGQNNLSAQELFFPCRKF